MIMPEIQLRAAASAIDQMPAAELQQALVRLHERREARTKMEVLLQRTELASLDLDQAAYQLASEAEAKGDLARAAHWYTAAALNDFGDAPLRLASILDALAGTHLTAQDGKPATREELDLVSEACRWYADAVTAGEFEADELLENLIERHLGKSRRVTDRTGAARPGGQPGGARPPSDPETHQDPQRVRICQDVSSD
jgi:TPR repeat protein